MFDERTVVATLNMNEPGALNTDNKDLQTQNGKRCKRFVMFLSSLRGK